MKVITKRRVIKTLHAREVRKQNRILRLLGILSKRNMKATTFKRVDYHSEQDNFQISVETDETMLTDLKKRISLERPGLKASAILLADPEELSELMLLLTEFAEVWDKEEKAKHPQMVSEEVKKK